MITDLHLDGANLIVYATIYGFCQDGVSWFTGSASYLAEWSGKSRRTVMNILKELTDKGLLEKQDVFENGVKYCKYRPTYFNNNKGYEETSHRVCNNFTSPCEETSHNNINNKIDNNIDIVCDTHTTQELIDIYMDNYNELYEDGILEKDYPVINWKVSKKLLKEKVELYGFDNIRNAIIKSKDDMFCIKNGYCLSTILSSGVLSELINGADLN